MATDHNFKIKNGLAVAGTEVIDSSLNIGAGGAADSSYDLKVHGLARFEGVANFISNFQVGGFTVITSSRNMQNIGNINIGGYYAMDGTTLIDTSKNIVNVGSITASDTIHSKGFVNYASNQDEPYLIASTSGWTGATTNWNTYGFQHRLKTNSGGVPRVTIDVASGEAFSVNNSKETHMRGQTIVASGTHNASNASNNDALIVGSAFIASSAQLFVDGFSRFSGPLYLSKTSSVGNYIGLTYLNDRLTLTDNGNDATAAIDAPDGYYISNQQVITASRNLTNIGTISSGAITASGSSVFNPTDSMVIINEPSTNTDLQTTLRVGTYSGGLFLTTNNAIISKGAYYDGNWYATATTGSSIDFTGNNRLSFSTFSGATVGNTVGLSNRGYFDASGLTVIGAVTANTLNTGHGDNELYPMNQAVRTTDSPTFATLNVTGDLNVTGNINSVNVTDLDVTDKTITVGAGGTASANDGAGIVVDGAGASLKWDNGDSKWAMNKALQFDDTPTTTNQNLGIYWTGFDKEGTTDFSDSAYIRHTTSIQGFATALEIKSSNDAGDGILFTTHGSSKLKHNSNNIATETWVNSQGFLTSFTEADTLNTVTSRGSTTSNSISTGAITTTGGTITINNAGGPSFRIRKYNTTDYDNVIYYDNTTSTSGLQNRIFLGRDGDSVTIRSNGNAIATFSNSDPVLFAKDLNLNSNVLMFANTSTTNRDHIWHDDTGNFGRPGTFHFASDTTRKATGNAAIIAGAYGVGTTEVITNSRNLVNIGTISSGAITSSGGLTASGTVSTPQVDYKNGSNIISAEMLSTDTLSFTGDSGQLFSITDSSSGTIFSVNDISGVPSIEVEDDGTIRLAETFGNVGIGTDNPSTKLEVVGGAMQLTNGTSGTYIKAVQTTNTANAGFFMASGSSSWFNLVDTSGRYQIYDGDAGQVRVYIDGSGNVGIGSTPSSYKLEVAGTIHGNATSGAHRFVSTSSTGPVMIVKPADAQTGIHAIFEYRSANQGSANYMMVNGTSTYFATYEGALPSDESKMIRITPNNSLNPSIKIGDSGSDDAQLLIDDTIRLSGKSTTTSYINAGNFGIGTTSPADRLEIRNNHSQLRLTDSDDSKFVQFSYSGGKLVVRNNNTGTSVNQFTLAENNRFGIGTISPSYTLDVSSGAANDARIRAFTGNSNAGAYFRAQSGLDGFYGVEFYHQTTAKWFIGGYGNNRLGFYVGEKSTAANEKMSLTTAGNFGIGTTSPSTKLHLYTGGVGNGVTDMLRIELNRVDHGTTPSGPAILFKDQDTNNSTNEARIKMMTVNDTDYGDNDEAASNLVFETTNGGTASDKMIITGRGHVGIGVDNPAATLHIQNTSTNSEVMRITTTGDNPDRHMYFQSDHIYSNGQLHLGTGNQTNQYRAHVHKFMYGTSNAEAMRIDSSGRVGIGNDNPSAILHVHDNASYSNMLFRVDGQYNDVKFNGGSTGTNGVWEFENIGTWAQTRFYVQDANNDNGRLTFDFRGNGGSNKILAGTSGGRVGIGTTNPLYPLQVTGSIYANGGNVYIDSGNKLVWGNSTQWIEGNNNTNIEFGVQSTVRARLVAEALQVEGGAGLRLHGGARSDAPEGTYYNWFMTGQGTDTTTWKKVCDVTISTGLYRALAMSIQARSQSGNFGSTVAVATEEYTALFYRSAGTQDDQNRATLIGHNAHDHELRIVKTSTGNYELQAKQKTTYRDLILEIYVLSTNGGTVTIPTTGTNGSTSGTVYNITRPTNSTSHPMRALPRIQAPALNLKASDGDNLLILDEDGGRGRARFYRNNADAYGMIFHDGTNFALSTTAGDVLVNQDTLTLQYTESEQTNARDTTTTPSASAQQEALQIRSPSYQDGRYTTQIAKIDRSGGLPLYFRESLGTANSYENRMRIGMHGRVHGGYVTETFGSAMFQGRLAVTSGEMLRRYEPAWASGTPEHTVLYNSYKTALGDYTTLKTPGNSGSAHGVFVVGDNGAHFGRTNLEVGDVVANNSATAPFDSQNWGRIDATGFHSYSTITTTDGSGTLTISGDNSGNNYIEGSGEFRFRPSGTTINKFVIGNNGNLTTAGTISGGSSIGNLDDANDIGQQMEKGDAATTTLRFDSNRWRLYGGGAGGVGEIFSVREDGNIGIGTSDPKGHLQSNSTAYLPFNSSGRYLTINNSNGAFLNLQSTASTAGEQIGGLMWTDTNGAGDAHKQVAQIDAYVENSGTDANDGASMRFWTKVAGAANSAPTMTLYHNRSVEIHEGTLYLGTYNNTDDGIIYLRGSTANKQATIRCTNGNLHIDANAGNNTYINYYTGNSIYFGTGAGGTAAEITAAGRLYVGTGAAASPSLSFLGDTNTGFYRPAADNIGFAVGGIARAFMSGTQFNMTGNGVFSGSLSVGGSTVISSAKHLENIAKFDTNLVPRTFALANTGGSSDQWVYIGQIDSLSQHGATVSINLHSNSGYNASNSQNAEAVIRFKTSNSSSNQSGFYGDCQYYKYGQNTGALSELRVVQVNTGRFQFYGKFGNHTGVNSNYTVAHSSGTWTNGGTFSGTAPTGTQITATQRRIFTSGFAQNEDLNLGTGDVTCTNITATGAGSSLKGPVYIAQQNTTGEGGELSLVGSNGNSSHTLDTVNGTFRIFENSGTFLSGSHSSGLDTTAYKVANTTVISSSRILKNVTIRYGSTGARFETGGWHRTSEDDERFYFASGSHSYYRTGGSAGTHYWRNGNDVTRAELDASGNFIAEGNVTAYGAASDIRIKENIEVIPDSVEKVKSLRGVTFNYKKDGKRSTGLVAQELQKVLPEAVYETKDGAEDGEDILAIRYGNVVGLLVEALKEQQTQIDNLTALVNELKEK